MGTLFFYGTLRHPALREAVLGHDRVAAVRARLRGYSVACADGDGFPLLRAAPGEIADGVVVTGLGEEDVARLDFYESGFDFALQEAEVDTDAGVVTAQVYFPLAGRWQPGPPWSLDDWVRKWSAVAVEACGEFMSYFGQRAPTELVSAYPTMLVRAASRLRARSDPGPATVRRSDGVAEVQTEAIRRPYASFFMTEEQDLRYPRFDGRPSSTVTRAAFVMGDAVTVLPYDPVRDRVMVVEQWRFGPYVRGDHRPFSLEAIAGRIDPGETPEQAGRREAGEEARLDLGALEFVGSYYPSPGAVSEFLFSFIGVADLPDAATGVSGVAAEEEDICAHVLSFERLMDLVASGEAANGPLMLSAFWLQANRDRLRGEP